MPSGGRYNALHWRSVKRSRTPGAGSLDEMRLMYYSANWQLRWHGRLAREPLKPRRSWTSGFTEDERTQTFWGKRYIDDAVRRRRDRDANGTWDDSFFYVTDAQFSTVAMAKPNGGIVERITYDSYGKARHHFGADVTGDGATTSANGTAIQNAYGNSIGDAGYKAELDLDRDGDIDSDDYNAGIALSGGVTQSALAGGMVSFVSTGSGGSTRHGPDNPIAWDGYVFNAETSQYCVRFRWYDPVLGRWLETDPLKYVDGNQLYEYVRSAPFATDPYALHRLPDRDGEIARCEAEYQDCLRNAGRAGISCEALREICYQGIDSRIFLQWWKAEMQDLTWLSGLPDCPCHVEGARDAGQWNTHYARDLLFRKHAFLRYDHHFDCTNASDSWNIRRYHPGASACCRSTFTNAHGAGQQCCYDAAGDLITSGSGAGTPDRAPPGTRRHWNWDVRPFRLAESIDKPCCDDRYRRMYNEARPPNQGTGKCKDNPSPWVCP